uniref:Uncharacterized protein n=1 Tax=Mycena chlorophos TaxID=658473 RepID=A0ABQ0L2M2_MYCCL|nr:predicted protein [Mycena chlorophos]
MHRPVEPTSPTLFSASSALPERLTSLEARGFGQESSDASEASSLLPADALLKPPSSKPTSEGLEDSGIGWCSQTGPTDRYRTRAGVEHGFLLPDAKPPEPSTFRDGIGSRDSLSLRFGGIWAISPRRLGLDHHPQTQQQNTAKPARQSGVSYY